MTEIDQDHSMKPINSLCVTDNGSVQINCFKLAQPLQGMLNNYYMLSHRKQSCLFDRVWASALRRESKAKLTLSDVVDRIWNPVFTECCQLVESVQSKSIKLRDVDQLFRDFKDVRAIRSDLRTLFSALEACYNRKIATTGWIEISVKLMEQYQSLREQAEAAKIVLDLKESLSLTGDFEIIEGVASKVTESMKDEPLDKIDGSLKNATSFLKQVTGKSSNLDCLRTFAACSSIVEWIRKETKG